MKSELNQFTPTNTNVLYMCEGDKAKMKAKLNV